MYYIRARVSTCNKPVPPTKNCRDKKTKKNSIDGINDTSYYENILTETFGDLLPVQLINTSSAVSCISVYNARMYEHTRDIDFNHARMCAVRLNLICRRNEIGDWSTNLIWDILYSLHTIAFGDFMNSRMVRPWNTSCWWYSINLYKSLFILLLFSARHPYPHR